MTVACDEVSVVVAHVLGVVDELGKLDVLDVLEAVEIGTTGTGASSVSVAVTDTISVDGGGYSVIVVGEGAVTVNMMVDGVSDSVTTMVDSCVAITVCVCVTASVTVVAVAASPPVLPPSTATTEYEAGSLRSIAFGYKGRAWAAINSEAREIEEKIGLEVILNDLRSVSSM